MDINLSNNILNFGKRIFDRIGKESPSSFNPQFWTGRIMDWTMKRPDLKVNMFRLVDVLPTLESSETTIRHLNEYLSEVGTGINPVIDIGLKIKPSSLPAKLVSLVVKKGVNQVARQFIAGETPLKALRPLRTLRDRGFAFTTDLLGEYCVSEKEADAYLKRYLEALDAFANHLMRDAGGIIPEHPLDKSPICISVKLTALYSQCSILNRTESVRILSNRLGEIASKTRLLGGTLYVDAEDMGNNPIIYETFMNLFGSSEFRDWPYPGIVIQAYAKESSKVVDSFIAFAKKRGTPIAIRLVKGAYWDHETISARQNGWQSPLFSQKESTDANYENLSRVLIDNREFVFPAFGSHNIRSLSHSCCYAASRGLSAKDFEIQVLFGMADPIAAAFRGEGFFVRQYVPLGEMLPGMGYLVRRLLENTSNESFLRHTFFEAENVTELLREPKMSG